MSHKRGLDAHCISSDNSDKAVIPAESDNSLRVATDGRIGGAVCIVYQGREDDSIASSD